MRVLLPPCLTGRTLSTKAKEKGEEERGRHHLNLTGILPNIQNNKKNSYSNPFRNIKVLFAFSSEQAKLNFIQ